MVSQKSRNWSPIYQEFPKDGLLFKNMNLSIQDLRQRTDDDQSPVYYYVVDTVGFGDGRFVQQGSGPNIQGDLITLTSCKHYMRSLNGADEWVGMWVAGFTGSKVDKRNSLFYLMKVKMAFLSYRHLWESECIPERTMVAKAAELEKFGDLYRPKLKDARPFNPRDYVEPCDSHVHCEPGDYRKDVRYVMKGQRPVLLVGDPKFSFLWDRPIMKLNTGIGRGHRRHVAVSDLLNDLR